MNLDHYAFIRPRIVTGDAVALSSSADLFDWFIQHETHSLLTHVGLILRFPIAGVDRVYFYQAAPGTGVNIVPLSFYLAQFVGRAWYVPLDRAKASALNPDYQTTLLNHAAERFGTAGYDWPGIAHFKLPWVRPDPAKFFCSKLMSTELNEAGLRMPTFESPVQVVSQPIFCPMEEL